ncbi:MAG: protoporphyrinogen oxidase [Acidimicrobiia bacterium]|nr:protoporphyrinogen oxidase [Acidimicrobiia bacterium]MDH5236363.1 protoporphyrinogen oxidase [Acidimicrobiia bacterium]
MTGTIAVIGGGIAGLAAAFEATRRGAEVTLLEAEEQAGGKLVTSPFAGLQVDEGADAFLARVPWAYELCAELGLADELVSPAIGSARVWLDDQLWDLPTDAVLGVPLDPDALARSGAVSAEAVAAVEADRRRTEPVSTDHGDSVSRFVRDRLGDEVFERLVGPLLGGINAGDVERLSLAAAVPQFAAVADEPSLSRALERQRATVSDPSAPVFYAHPRGMAHIVQVLSDRLRSVVHTGEPVDALEPLGDRWRIRTRRRCLDADGVIVAVPAPSAARLLDPLTGPTPLAAIEHAGVVMATFAWPTSGVAMSLDTSGFLVPRSAGLLLSAASISSSKWAHLGGADQVIVRASAGRFGDERALALDDEALVAALLADLDRTMGLVTAPTAVRVVRWPASFPQYTPGHLDRISEVEQAVHALGGVALAGGALRGVGIPACIRSGRDAAARLLDH